MEDNYVVAIRIYCDKYRWPMADMKMTDGTVKTIRWYDFDARDKYRFNITGFTIIYDERIDCDWDGIK